MMDRYDMDVTHDGFVTHNKHIRGDWVKADEAEAEIARLKQENTSLCDELDEQHLRHDKEIEDMYEKINSRYKELEDLEFKVIDLQSLLSEARDLIAKPLNSMGVGEKLSWKANIRAFLSKTEGINNE